ncbi:unknown protein [Desulfotalea psychrophila LSv54]|uniref:Uncharacterized protein n=1 Tax=Desulfotalea psychrophila (strain LSv54 / DSM 12343) TaxID=177439 RepID=Q6AIC4_DESPS|nr:unknown protein [Desulfotalea psychrophila LSv54]
MSFPQYLQNMSQRHYDPFCLKYVDKQCLEHSPWVVRAEGFFIGRPQLFRQAHNFTYCRVHHKKVSSFMLLPADIYKFFLPQPLVKGLRFSL